jgi:hypothetical protein
MVAVNFSASREPRAVWGPEDKWTLDRGVTCQITRLPEPHDRSFAPQPSGTNAYSSAQASGWRASEEGDGRHCGCQTASPARFPKPAAGFRRRALFRKALVANQERLVLPWPRRIVVRSQRPDSIEFPRFNLGERTTTLATVPTGLADSREPTCLYRPMAGTTKQAGIARASRRSSDRRSIARRDGRWPRRTSCPTAATTGLHQLPRTETTG